MDLLYRIGVRRLEFMLPDSDVPVHVRARNADGRTWLQRYVAEHPLPQAGCRLLLEGKPLVPATGGPALQLPPPPARGPGDPWHFDFDFLVKLEVVEEADAPEVKSPSTK
jgi:hypothetical protein